MPFVGDCYKDVLNYWLELADKTTTSKSEEAADCLTLLS